LDNLQTLLDEACDRAASAVGSGRVADYIPELAKADPTTVGIAVHTTDGTTVSARNASQPFTLQSASKVFALACLMTTEAATALDDMPCEPSGDAFHSIVRLEEERGHPRNPFINAGAILVSSRLPGETAAQKFGAVSAFLSAALKTDVAIDMRVYESESATGYRNRALANYMQHFGVLQNADVACDAYFRQCSLSLEARSLARAGLFLANRGVDPLDGREVISPASNRSILALMTTCGLYDQVGEFALKVGLPAKSAVSGAMLAIVPGKMSIATYGPALGPKGNSIAGMVMLEFLSKELRLSLFG
jgi:glutaminase